MKSQFRHIALIGKTHATLVGSALTASRQVLDKLTHFLHDQGCDVTIEQETAAHLGLSGHQELDVAGIGAECDLALVVGGDGSMLGFGRQLAPYGVPLIGINQGRLGFITDIPLDKIEATLRPMLQGEYTEDRRSLLQAKVIRDDRCVFDALALNDVVVNRGGTSGMVELRVEVDGRFVANQRADGLIIATATGSTGYSMAAGGPILHPGVEAIVVNPICAMSLSSRPLVVPPRAQLAVWPLGEANRKVRLWKDGAHACVLEPGDRCRVGRAPHAALMVLLEQSPSYYRSLSRKLHWAGSLTAAEPSPN